MHKIFTKTNSGTIMLYIFTRPFFSLTVCHFRQCGSLSPRFAYRFSSLHLSWQDFNRMTMTNDNKRSRKFQLRVRIGGSLVTYGSDGGHMSRQYSKVISGFSFSSTFTMVSAWISTFSAPIGFVKYNYSWIHELRRWFSCSIVALLNHNLCLCMNEQSYHTFSCGCNYPSVIM